MRLDINGTVHLNTSAFLKMDGSTNTKNQSSDDESEFESESGDFNELGQQYSNNYDIERNEPLISTDLNDTIKKRKRSPWANPSKAVKWTEDMDDRLKDAFKHYPKDWVKAAQHVGCGVKKDQCRHRWNMYVDPATSQLNRGQWSSEEETNLRAYVTTHEGIKSTRKIPVGRSPTDCQHKWTSMRQSVLRKGPWSLEEDKIIVARFIEWGDRGQGLWASLEREMGRSSRNILSRWKSNLSMTMGPQTLPSSLTYQQQPSNLNVISTFHNNPSNVQFDYSQILSSGTSRIKLPVALQHQQQQQSQSQHSTNFNGQPQSSQQQQQQQIQLQQPSILLPAIPPLPGIPPAMYTLPSPAPLVLGTAKQQQHNVVMHKI